MVQRQQQEAEIDKSRGRYREQIVKLEKELDKVQRDEDKNAREQEEQRREVADLQDYEDTFKGRKANFQLEITELQEFEQTLRRSSEQIDSTLTDKEACKDKSFSVKLEITALRTRRDGLLVFKE